MLHVTLHSTAHLLEGVFLEVEQKAVVFSVNIAALVRARGAVTPHASGVGADVVVEVEAEPSGTPGRGFVGQRNVEDQCVYNKIGSIVVTRLVKKHRRSFDGSWVNRQNEKKIITLLLVCHNRHRRERTWQPLYSTVWPASSVANFF